MTPLHCGSFRVGYRNSSQYGSRVTKNGNEDGISLGTAVAISGAAASPNMGYHSSPSATLLMTLFNARLGWWLGNPGVAGRKTYTSSHPQFAIQPLIAEAFGRTKDTNQYVYLSDGGHFENLGLYEAVIRRCHVIIASDASCDGDFKFDDLGNAIRKIRIDLGISIDFENGIPIGGAECKSYCAVARIRYTAVDSNARDGVLVYIKPAVYGSEPCDVVNYRTATAKRFPHESTSDQWFSETQFESYRTLGCHVVQSICEGHESGDLVDMAEWTFAQAHPTGAEPVWINDLRRVATIQFEASRCDIVPAEAETLKNLAESLRRRGCVRISLIGRRAAFSEARDAAMAERRAYAVAAALEAHGLKTPLDVVTDSEEKRAGRGGAHVDIFAR
jgi:hypothetical protein